MNNLNNPQSHETELELKTHHQFHHVSDIRMTNPSTGEECNISYHSTSGWSIRQYHRAGLPTLDNTVIHITSTLTSKKMVGRNLTEHLKSFNDSSARVSTLLYWRVRL